MTLKALVDFDGTVIDREQLKGGVYAEYSSLIGVLRYLVDTGVVKTRDPFDRIMEAHQRFKNHPQSYQHWMLATDSHDYLGEALNELSVEDVRKAACTYWSRSRGSSPKQPVAKAIEYAKKFGEIYIITGSPTIFVQAYNDVVLKPLGLDVDKVIGVDPIVVNGSFKCDKQEVKVLKVGMLDMEDGGYKTQTNQRQVLKMNRRLDTANEKYTEMLDLGFTRKALREVAVFGDSPFEIELFKNAGYACMVDPTPGLQRYGHTEGFGILLTSGTDYTKHVIKMLDFLYTMPHSQTLRSNGSEISLHRVMNTNSGRVHMEVTRPSGNVLIGELKIGNGLIYLGERDFDGFALARRFNAGERAVVWKALEDARSKSRLDEVDEAYFVRKPRKVS